MKKQAGATHGLAGRRHRGQPLHDAAPAGDDRLSSGGGDERRGGGEDSPQAESPHLILMDLSLPVIDGLAATRLIRKLPIV